MPDVIIENLHFTLFYDYDFHLNNVLQRLSDDGKIDWLEQRMNMVFLEPLKVIHDRTSPVFVQLEHPHGGPPMTIMLMTTSMLMNGIEALGSFLTTSTKNNVCFHKFMDTYMPDWTKVVTVPHHSVTKLSTILWKSYRNGLAHSFVIKHAGIEPVPDPNKYQVSNGTLQIDVWKFFNDLNGATTAMFTDVRNNAQTKRTFLRRFRLVYMC